MHGVSLTHWRNPVSGIDAVAAAAAPCGSSPPPPPSSAVASDVQNCKNFISNRFSLAGTLLLRRSVCFEHGTLRVDVGVGVSVGAGVGVGVGAGVRVGVGVGVGVGVCTCACAYTCV
jgi:hypothetical protein